MKRLLFHVTEAGHNRYEETMSDPIPPGHGEPEQDEEGEAELTWGSGSNTYTDEEWESCTCSLRPSILASDPECSTHGRGVGPAMTERVNQTMDPVRYHPVTELCEDET